ncbi:MULTISPECIES: hypothetical protein [Micromonospora]|uniref:Ribbon-helix-helix protein, copG family n=1 Tax=Micromonospora solifontis TaxID=2487138 RepID=A0ABX9WI54_9ACTN|nr:MULTISPECIES: hypothetical protein [Micromonospora]NES13986.1 hypothetical protein [Micromonospora sp. PPF5-17B]NES37117.1 hypothetical protein [Micromonospora solifontis]NES54086.1 hypothetical protein [Micromonospora sp. PPF5-6]RNL98673.1 hypothetical protein EFE23_13255 [Micromonospora solifontis]
MDTTIKVDAEVRDRLTVLARERGISMRDLVAEFARATPTREELRERAARAEAYLRSRLAPQLDDEDLARAEGVWAAIESGDAPESLAEPRRRVA